MALKLSDPAVQAALIAAVVSLVTTLVTLIASAFGAPFKYWLEKKALRAKLDLEYESAQRKQLRDLITRYKGQLIEATEAVDNRCRNLYRNDPDGWMDVRGDYKSAQYYFRTTLYRFLSLAAIARAFEREAIYIDYRIANSDDFVFLNLIKAWNWAISDVALFEGLPYDHAHARDHIFHDEMKRICELVWEEGRMQTHGHFRTLLKETDELNQVCRFMDGIRSGEHRYRWDRLVTIHLLVLLFQNEFGYPTRITGEAGLVDVAKLIRHKRIVDNLVEWLPKLGLDKSDKGKEFRRALLNCAGELGAAASRS